MSSTTPALPVVVGIDGTAASRDALAFALREGLARSATVQVITTWVFGGTLQDASRDDSVASETRDAQATQDAALAETLKGFDERPDIAQIVVHGECGHTLVEAAKDAAMLVVGNTRKGVLARTFLGSVSEYCVRHSPVPVVVVPDSACVDPLPPGGVVDVAPASV